jgi:hypothetical protein
VTASISIISLRHKVIVVGGVTRMPNNSFKLTGPFVTRLAVWESRQAARQPSLQLNSVR